MNRMRNFGETRRTRLALLMTVAAAVFIFYEIANGAAGKPQQDQPAPQQSNTSSEPRQTTDRETLLLRQSQEEADSKTKGCLSCHSQTDSLTMHETNTVRIGCTDAIDSSMRS